MNAGSSRFISAVLFGMLLSAGCEQPESKPISAEKPNPNGPILLFDGSRNQFDHSASDDPQSDGRSDDIRK